MRAGAKRRPGTQPAGFALALPALLGLLGFVALPFLLAVGLSFTNLRLGSPLPVEFVGLEQFRRVFADETFLRALRNNAVFALVVANMRRPSLRRSSSWWSRSCGCSCWRPDRTG